MLNSVATVIFEKYNHNNTKKFVLLINDKERVFRIEEYIVKATNLFVWSQFTNFGSHAAARLAFHSDFHRSDLLNPKVDETV